MEIKCQNNHRLEINTIAGDNIISPVDGIIHWHILENKFTPDMDKYKVILAFTNAFNTWGNVFNPIKFESTSSIVKSQITVGFYKNGDADLPFTFEKGVLAYAFAPGSHKYSSDMFFNEAYNWQEMHSSGAINLFKVAVHEMGHAFNLGHSEDIKDIMYPIYQPNNNVVITQDTINRINSLYEEYMNSEEVSPVNAYKQVFKEIFNSKKLLARLTEVQLITLGNYIEVSASVDDLKKHTVDKIYNALS